MNRYEEDTRKFKELLKYRVKCRCSHSVVLSKVDRAICTHCGNWVYRTPQLKFQYKIKEFLNKEEKNDGEIRQTK